MTAVVGRERMQGLVGAAVPWPPGIPALKRLFMKRIALNRAVSRAGFNNEGNGRIEPWASH